MELEIVIEIIKLLKRPFFWTGKNFISFDQTVSIPLEEMNRLHQALAKHKLYPPDFNFI